MKSVEFSEEQLQDKQTLVNMLLADERDPRSWAYKRINVRPKICWWRVIGYILLPVALFLLLLYISDNVVLSLAVCAAFCLVYGILTAKRAVICLVKIYQRCAPDSIRNKCRFEPSCSTYMILSIEKYGLFSGIKKGINRLQRCRIGDGGFENP